MMNGTIEYKVALFVIDVLNNLLDKNRKKLVEQQKDKDCSVEIYENTLDFCNQLEYAIKQIERFRK
tara:strand:+ start:662 stop:859 length:198 start_codon:yes stop_codon:yes gene_type:complete